MPSPAPAGDTLHKAPPSSPPPRHTHSPAYLRAEPRSYTATVPSSVPAASCCPSGEKPRQVTQLVCDVNTRTHEPAQTYTSTKQTRQHKGQVHQPHNKHMLRMPIAGILGLRATLRHKNILRFNTEHTRIRGSFCTNCNTTGTSSCIIIINSSSSSRPYLLPRPTA